MKSFNQITIIQPTFDESFIENYAHNLVTIPEVAIIELIANCWDAGANKVEITWPKSHGGYFEIIDNGFGMTYEEFTKRWSQFNYNRRKWQDNIIVVPNSNKPRKVYGRNGKGRHSLFCFSEEYSVETCKNGKKSFFNIKRERNGINPYLIEFNHEAHCDESGTKISCNIEKNYRDINEVKNLIGTKFIAEPSFEIYLNEDKIEAGEILNFGEVFPLDIEDEGTVEIFLIDSRKAGRTSLLNGVAYWVNNREVGDHSWKDFEGILLDGRTNEAKRYTIVVKADILENEVLEDWTGFSDSERSLLIRSQIKNKIFEIIGQLMQNIRKESKRKIIDNNRQYIRELGDFGKDKIGLFIDEVQRRCPTINRSHFSNVVEILANMEISQTKYRLLKQLGSVSPEDIDKLSNILDNWSITDAKIILDELHWRLKLIKKIESLVDDPTTDELHELQPLFHEGLWIFGPEYDTKEFYSNKWLLTIVKQMYKHKIVEKYQSRPDFVILSDTSISIHTTDAFDSKTEQIKGYAKILIIELKKGKSTIGVDELDQARNYAIELKKSGELVSQSPQIVCFVLGTTVDCENSKYGTIEVYPQSYHIILRQAEKRTFNLISKITELKNINAGINDEEIKASLEQEELTKFVKIEASK